MEITTQFIIVMAYFLIVIGVGVFATKLVKTSKDILVAGRNLGLALTTVAIAAEWLGGTSTVAVGQWAFKYGISPIWYNISTSIGMFLFGLTWAALYRKMQVYTVPEMIERVYDRRTRLTSAIFFIAAYLLLSAVQIGAIGALFSGALKMDINTAIIIAGLGITIYTLAGGMYSVALTNFIHVFVIWGGMIAAYLFYMSKVGWYDGIRVALDNWAAQGAIKLTSEKALSPFGMGRSVVLAWILGGITGTFAAQASVQPVFAAKDWKTAKRAALLTPLIVAPLGFLVTSIVLAAISLHGNYVGTETRLAFPLALMYIPNPIIGGIAMAGVFAAIASTEAPILLGMATMFVRDVYSTKIKPGAKDKEVLLATRVTTFAVGIISIIMALVIKELPIATYVNYAMRGAVFVILALAIYWAKPSSKAAIISIYSALITAIIWYAYYMTHKSYPHGIHIVYATLFVSFVIALLVTYLVPGGKRDITPKELLVPPEGEE
jgi:SSS family solute:Na+ symporter